jgi:hypothetical protein
MSKIPNCHKCIHSRSIPGDAHLQCTKPSITVRGHPYGVNNGWFLYPFNYDPRWMQTDCGNFASKEPESTENSTRTT